MIMKGKMKFCILAVFVLTVAAMWFGTKEAGAFTIAEDGKYALVLNLKGSDKEVANIDGQSGIMAQLSRQKFDVFIMN